MAQLFSWRDVYLTLENVLLNHQESFKTKSTIQTSKKPSTIRKSEKTSNFNQDENNSFEVEKSEDKLTNKLNME